MLKEAFLAKKEAEKLAKMTPEEKKAYEEKKAKKKAEKDAKATAKATAKAAAKQQKAEEKKKSGNKWVVIDKLNIFKDKFKFR